MLVLGVHSGWQDAGAALFDDYELIAAVPQARLTGVARDGGRLPWEAVRECLAIADLQPGAVGALALSHGVFPSRYFTGLPLGRRVGRGLRALFGRETPTSLAAECRRSGRRDAEAMIDTAALLADLGLNRNIPVRFYSQHAAHALLPLFHTGWDEGLVFTADAGGDGTACGVRLLKYGRLGDVYGEGASPVAVADDTAMLARLVMLSVEGLGLPDAAALQALSAYGEPMLAQALLAHFDVDDDGRIHAAFDAEGGLDRWLRRLAEGHPPALVAASVQKCLEDVFARTLLRLMRRHEMRNLALGGSLFDNPRLVHALAAQLSPAGLTVHPLSGDAGLPLGGALDFLLARDGIAAWLQQRRPWQPVETGRDYAADIDPVLGNAGCRLVSKDPLHAAAALLNAGKSVIFYDHRATLGRDGGAARALLFAGTEAGAAAKANDRLGRPGFMPATLYLRRDDAAAYVSLPAALPASLLQGGAVAAPLAERWRSRLPGAMAPDFLVLPYPVSPEAEPRLAELLGIYAGLSGVPALLGLPLQLDGEAPLDAPGEVRRLLDGRHADYIMTEYAVWERGD